MFDEYLYDGEDVLVVVSDVVFEIVINIEVLIEYSVNNFNVCFSVYEFIIDDVLFSGY